MKNIVEWCGQLYLNIFLKSLVYIIPVISIEPGVFVLANNFNEANQMLRVANHTARLGQWQICPQQLNGFCKLEKFSQNFNPLHDSGHIT